MPVSERTYKRLVLEDPDEKWELHCGRLVRKPGMTFDHFLVARRLGFFLQLQLPIDAFIVAVDNAKVRTSPGSFFTPDVAVIPVALTRPHRGRRVVEVYSDPLPLIAEVWSPSTGGYDVTTKLPEFQRRGDAEIWLIHPYDHTIRAWRRGPDGSYAESFHTGGLIRLVALPHVAIDLDTLFD